MIVVVDSGIWISAFHFGGVPQVALDSVFSRHTIAICDPIVAEVRTTLVEKFSWKNEEVFAILREYTREAIHFEVTGAIAGVCRDAKDDMVFECAVNSRAEIILSGDKDILAVKSYRGIRILTARQFVDRFASLPG